MVWIVMFFMVYMGIVVYQWWDEKRVNTGEIKFVQKQARTIDQRRVKRWAQHKIWRKQNGLR